MRFQDLEILERHPIEGDGFEARARTPDGKEVCVWAGAVEPRDPGADPDEIRKRLAKVYHAAFPRVLAAGREEGRAYLVVQGYRGRTLADRLAEGPLQPTEAMDVARGVAAGLVKAHRAGVIHGWVAPGEILLAEDGRTLLLHLGLGPLLRRRPSRAPEEPAGEDRAPTEEADVFGLSRVLLESLLGEDPVGREAPQEAPVTPESLPPRLPEGLRRFLARAVSPDRQRRIHRAEEFAGDLGVIRASWDSLSAPPARGTVVRSRVPRWPALLAGALAVLAAALILRSCAS